ncbi:MAG: hypothetical protein GKR95_25780 [Gammaproteobacteria bacterium]|nr:hypothetical protein [Gammaproteobacteria bacterium]
MNTQLYNHLDEANKAVKADKMTKPFNLPDPLPESPNMKGFVTDYINTLQVVEDDQFRNPKASQYEVIMQCYKPKQIPVLTTLAKEFAVFDHWFCSVPSQTWCNRAFWHSATSGGQVINPDPTPRLDGTPKKKYGDWLIDVSILDSFFQRMTTKGLKTKVYSDNAVSLNKLIYGIVATTAVIDTGSMEDFENEIDAGKLPDYAFIEPKFMYAHNDMHPSAYGPGKFGKDKTGPGSVALGDELIRKVYELIFTSSYKDNTLLIITFDEHGGCFDHIPPPPAVVPDEINKNGEKGFKFDRLGVRVPMVMVSSHIGKNTIVNDIFDHTSFIKTMSRKWGLEHINKRDIKANSFDKIFSDETRTDLPNLSQFKYDIQEPKLDYKQLKLNDLQRSILYAASVLASEQGVLVKSTINVDEIDNVHDAVKYLDLVSSVLGR